MAHRACLLADFDPAAAAAAARAFSSVSFSSLLWHAEGGEVRREGEEVRREGQRCEYLQLCGGG